MELAPLAPLSACLASLLQVWALLLSPLLLKAGVLDKVPQVPGNEEGFCNCGDMLLKMSKTWIRRYSLTDS
jgi:hypothetical protein